MQTGIELREGNTEGRISASLVEFHPFAGRQPCSQHTYIHRGVCHPSNGGLVPERRMEQKWLFLLDQHGVRLEF